MNDTPNPADPVSPSGRLQGKVAVVTGGNSGIGLAAALAFAAEGARVVIAGRDPATLDAARLELGDGALAVPTDVARPADLRALFDAVRAAHGRVDVLFVNAGLARFGALGDVTEEDFDALMAVNLRGAFFTVQAALPLLAEGASVILNGSVNAHVGFAGASVYSASKAAVHSLARTLSAELAPRRVRVNTLSIGPVETPLFGKLGLPPETLEGFAGAVGGKIVLKRFGRPEEIARAAVFLASDESSFVVGAEVPVDGGLGLNALS